MLERTDTDRLIALLHDQRDEAGWRAGLTRNTPEWTQSSERLGVLNDRIMHDGARGPTAEETADPGPTNRRAGVGVAGGPRATG